MTTNKELTPLEAFKRFRNNLKWLEENIANLKGYFENKELCFKEDLDIIENALKEHENLKEENKMLRENDENLDENYFDTWSACENLKENSNYALMFIDDIYCLVDTKDNKFDVIDNYKINKCGIIDNGTQKKLKALEIIKRTGLSVDWFIGTFIKQDIGYSGFLICLEEMGTDGHLAKQLMMSEEEFDLLKEVLK